MKKRINIFVITSILISMLTGCGQNGNKLKDDIKNTVNDTKNTVSDTIDGVKDTTDNIKNNINNPDGNYKDNNGFIDDKSDFDQNQNNQGNIQSSDNEKNHLIPYDSNENSQSDRNSNPDGAKQINTTYNHSDRNTGFKEDEISIPTMLEINSDKLGSLDNTKQGWGQGNNKNENNQPIDAITFQKKYGTYNSYFIRDLDKRNIYLTFDEGYENGYTAPILDVLKDKEVSAVFFVTQPYVKDNSDLINRMINEGHIVGNHSVKHKSFPTITVEEGKSEVEGLHNYMKENYNYEMDLFRFPCGEFSERSLELVNQLGYRSIFWSFAYADWDPQKQMEPTQAKEKLLSAAHNGAIYLLHAVSKTNSEILGDVIDGLREKGFTISKF